MRIIMRTTITIYLITITLSQLLFAEASKGQALQKSLDISFESTSLYTAIQKLERESHIEFAFDEASLGLEEISIDMTTFEKESLGIILERLLTGTEIAYLEKGKNTIILHRKQQPGLITGRVTDKRGGNLAGATIKISEIGKTSITDSEGNFSINVNPGRYTVEVSYISYNTTEKTVIVEEYKTANLDFSLEEEENTLTEVVAIGYGTVARRDLTGAISSVSQSSLRDMPVTSIADAIVGRMAGVQVSRAEGSPDAAVKIRVRGGGSITQDNSPLYIVDGFPVDDISYISPTDVASIDVLKDASSTAIYGARGANGVILITTRSGSEGRSRIAYNGYFGIKNITKTLDVLDPYEYVYWQYELQNTNAKIDEFYGDFRDYELYKQLKGSNWQDELFGQTGTSYSNNLSFSGGTKSSTYNFSFTRNDEKEIMLGSGYTRSNLSLKTRHNLNEWLTADLNVRLSDHLLKGAGTSSGTRLSHAVQFRPVNGLMDYIDYDLDDGDYETASIQVLNPLKQTLDDYRRRKTLTTDFMGSLNAKLSESFAYKFEYGIQYNSQQNNRFYGINTSNVLNYGKRPITSIQQERGNSQRMANILTFSKNDMWGVHDLTAMVGQELNYAKSNSISNTSRFFPEYIDAEAALSMMNLGVADPTVTFDNPAITISSFFGRLNYAYKDKYIASATFRADGSSKFSPANRWGYFPSAALAWRLSDEEFMDNMKSWLNDLKIRASYGASGNNRIPDYAWQKTFTVGSGGIHMDGDGEGSTPTPYLQPSSVLANPDLKWETTVTRNVGLDFSLFGHAILGTVELYKNTTKDLLISASIPSNTGYSTQWQNIGQTSNRGVELTLSSRIIDKGDFRLQGSFNIGFNKNRIDKLGSTKRWEQSSDWFTSNSGPSGEYLINEGGQVGLMYGYETQGMYTFDDFEYKNETYTLKPGVSDNRALISAKRFWPGALKLKDQNGDLIVDAVNDKVVIGNANPKHSGGLNLSAQFKSIDLSTFFNWTYGNDIYNANKLYFSISATGYTFKNILDNMNSDNRFTYIDKSTGGVVSDPVQLAEMNKDKTMWSSAMNYAALHSWAVEDGSFLRLNTLTLGYTLPGHLLNKIHMSKLRVYGTVYNLWTWTNYTGFDPEVDSRRSTPLTPGIDWNAYPRSRSFNVGLQIEF